MKIEYQGEVYDFDEQAITVKQALKIEKHVGGTLGDWEDGLTKASALSMQALAWLILEGGGATPIGDVDFPMLPFATAVLSAITAEAEAAAAALEEGVLADPTSAPSPPPAET